MRIRTSKLDEMRKIMASIKKLERQVAASADEELKSQAKAIEKSDASDLGAGSVGGDQNERAMDNWPIEKRAKVAASLIKLADYLTH